MSDERKLRFVEDLGKMKCGKGESPYHGASVFRYDGDPLFDATIACAMARFPRAQEYVHARIFKVNDWRDCLPWTCKPFCDAFFYSHGFLRILAPNGMNFDSVTDREVIEFSLSDLGQFLSEIREWAVVRLLSPRGLSAGAVDQVPPGAWPSVQIGHTEIGFKSLYSKWSTGEPHDVYMERTVP